MKRMTTYTEPQAGLLQEERELLGFNKRGQLSLWGHHSTCHPIRAGLLGTLPEFCGPPQKGRSRSFAILTHPANKEGVDKGQMQEQVQL
jgi:hypothetical protein